MSAMTTQIINLTIVYSTFYSGADQRKHQSAASLAFVWRIYRWPVNSPHKRPVTRKMFPFDVVIMLSCYVMDLYPWPSGLSHCHGSNLLWDKVYANHFLIVNYTGKHGIIYVRTWYILHYSPRYANDVLWHPRRCDIWVSYHIINIMGVMVQNISLFSMNELNTFLFVDF